jgi:myo-inositol catabolism protein IolC
VGRTICRDPWVSWRGSKTSREAAVAAIAERYRGWVDLFEQARQGEWRGAGVP